MESKLNEILEMCVQKSCWSKNVFYGFQYYQKHKIIVISKNDKIIVHSRDISQALDYMRDE